MRIKHIPIRTCIACRTTDAKQTLLRLVRQPDGIISYDSKGKLSGRGAYICARIECILAAKKQKKLDRSFKISPIPETLFAELSEIINSMKTDEPIVVEPKNAGITNEATANKKS